MKRREFLIGLGGAALAIGSKADTAERISGKGPHLFLDDDLILTQENLHREITPPRRLPQPVVTGPEDKCFQPYVTVLRDPKTERFRIWYGVPENESQSHLATMESEDGIHWKRPHQVLKDPGPIQFGVSILEDDARDPDPKRRYKFGWWHNGGLQIAASPDGLDWKKIAPGPVLAHNHDINNIYYDPIRRRYGANVSIYMEGTDWKGKRRVPHQSYSDDLLHWSPPQATLPPDMHDEGETQFYCMGAMLTRGDLQIGMARVLRDDLSAEPGGKVAGMGYTVLAWSRDGVNWTRDREPFMDRSATPGAWDRAMTWTDCQILVGDETYLYYGGYKQGHKVERFTERQIGLARMPRDRYIARVAGTEAGTLQTPPTQVAGASLTVNAKVKGELRLALFTESGQPLPGFTALDCTPVRGDSVRHPMRWRRSLSALRGRSVRLHFVLQDTHLYGFEFSG
jgi:hypothetical protein